MKNNVKIVLAFILGLIIAGSIGVYAVIKIQADEVGYQNTTVDQALNDLYTLATSPLSYTAITPNSSQGERIATRNTSVTLNKGKYILVTGGVQNSFQSSAINTVGNASNAIISCNNCEYQLISSRQVTSSPSQTYNGNYMTIGSHFRIYYVEVSEDNTVVSANFDSTVNQSASSQISILGFKIY